MVWKTAIALGFVAAILASAEAGYLASPKTSAPSSAEVKCDQLNAGASGRNIFKWQLLESARKCRR